LPDRKAAYPGAAAYLPASHSLTACRKAVDACHGCPLYRRATHAVFGEGAAHSPLVLIGEQPGNDEDLSGRPFVGPSGKLLDRALAEAGVDRGKAYVTNVVKHFKWTPSGEKRLHKKPDAAEIAACRPWLEAELAAVKPVTIVALGATAGQALLGRAFRVTRQRGVPLTTPFAPHLIATIHPSAVLRQRTPDDRAREYAALVADLKVVAATVT
jgi:DNA polymerase